MDRALPIAVVVLMVVAAIATTAWLTGDSGSDQLRIAEVVGGVTVTAAESHAVDVKAGLALSAADRIVTGTDGRLVLQLGDDTMIRLAEDSTVQVASVSADELQLELEGGRISATVRPTSASVRVGSQGRQVLAVDADFEAARIGDNFAVEVDRGELGAQGIPGTNRIGQGERLLLQGDADPVMAPIPEDMMLEVEWPPKDFKTNKDVAVMAGRGEPGATIIVINDGKPKTTIVKPDGTWTIPIQLRDDINVVDVNALGLFGGTADARGEITADLGVKVGTPVVNP